MCWHRPIAEMANGVMDAARDAAPAAGAVGAFTATGVSVGAPWWLIAIGQTVGVIYFTLRGYDKREKRREEALRAMREDTEELRGAVTALSGRISQIPCVQSSQGPALTPCPPHKLITLGSE